jgi:hypothetical protein
MKRVATLFVLSSAAIAQLPEGPKAKIVDKKFIAMESYLAASITFDAYSTVAMRSSCHETNPFLGPHPSTGAVAGFMVAQFIGGSALSYLGKKYFANRLHGLGWIAPSFYLSTDHLRAGIHNYTVGCE